MADPSGRLTEQEIFAQPRLWREALEEASRVLPAVRQLWSAARPAEILLTGCGSSYYLALTASALLQTATHVPCRALPSSEILFADPGEGPARRPLLIAISRSGETTETVWALQRFKESGAVTVAVTCHEAGTLSQNSDLSLTLPIEERSVVMTGSFTSMLLALASTAAGLGTDGSAWDDLQRIPDLGARQFTTLADRAQAAAGKAPPAFVYLGSGAMYGLACEGALKMTEMALLPSCAYHTLEFLHGPKAALAAGSLVVGLLSAPGLAYEQRVLTHVAGLGADVLALGGEGADLPSLSFPTAPGTLPGMLLGVAWMQLLAFYVARGRGVNPDTPRYLDPVVMWERV